MTFHSAESTMGRMSSSRKFGTCVEFGINNAIGLSRLDGFYGARFQEFLQPIQVIANGAANLEIGNAYAPRGAIHDESSFRQIKKPGGLSGFNQPLLRGQ